MGRLLLASRNRGKILEIQALLEDLPIEILSMDDLGFGRQVEETGSSYEENARLKATVLAAESGEWVLGDDTGLEVEVLGGAPGLFSARYGEPGANDADRRQQLLADLAGKPRPWRARFCCAVAVASPSGAIDEAWGECAGEILAVERGARGFGYDRLFLVEGLGRTMAELSLHEKNQHSHRARAIRAISPVLMDKLGEKPG
jgi:XTP/dITP diphosphohydrolase